MNEPAPPIPTGDDLIKQARAFAVQAHQRIGHKRKYSNQPYDVHLADVANLVSEVVDDAEMIAAAWLHDTVEDTPVTLDEVEARFGPSVAELVEELTDVSRPGDGNRAVRKEIDRQHLAQASGRAKTVKLADLIDNCRDITRHDQRFARVYLVEMAALLDVLEDGSDVLHKRARKLHARSMEKLGPRRRASDRVDPDAVRPVGLPGFESAHVRRMFAEVFSAQHIAESLLSFDSAEDCAEVAKIMQRHRDEVAAVRVYGTVQGYVRIQDLQQADCAEQMRHFARDQVVDGEATLMEVIHVLTRHNHCFVSMLGSVTGVICRDDMNKPMVRMWLFGMVTLVEMGITQLIRTVYPDDSWHELVSEGRLEKAKEFQVERQRRNLHCDLIECLQFSDKGYILIRNQRVMERLGYTTAREGRRAVKSLESLRNNLAHAQDIVAHDWAQIARLSARIEELVR